MDLFVSSLALTLNWRYGIMNIWIAMTPNNEDLIMRPLMVVFSKSVFADDCNARALSDARHRLASVAVRGDKMINDRISRAVMQP